MKTPIRPSSLALALLLVLTGCGGGKKTPPPTPVPSGGGPQQEVAPPAKGDNPLEDVKVEVPPIPDKGSEGWGGGKIAPVEIASKMDAAMRRLRNVTVTATVVGKTPDGKIMPSRFPGEIQDDRTFRISYLRLDGNVPTTGIATADGKEVVVLGEGGLSTPKKLGTAPRRDLEALVATWPKSFPSVVFSGLIEGGDYWSALIGAWQRGVQGFDVSVEERTLPVQERKVKNYRVVAERGVPGPGKRVETVELVVDGQLFLPVTIRSHGWDERGREYQFQWSAEWKNNQKLDAAKFRIGKS